MTPTLVIIDDHAGFRAFARALLEAEGYDVVGEAADGVSGVELVCRLLPDVVLLDVVLPDLDGFAVSTRIAAQRLARLRRRMALHRDRVLGRARCTRAGSGAGTPSRRRRRGRRDPTRHSCWRSGHTARMTSGPPETKLARQRRHDDSQGAGHGTKAEVTQVVKMASRPHHPHAPRPGGGCAPRGACHLRSGSSRSTDRPLSRSGR